MGGSFDWQPSASLDLLRLRARLLASVRRFFDTRGYWEVDTPLVSRERVVDPHLEPFAALPEPAMCDGKPAAPPLYLHTSPEFPMKRLLAAGAEAIYQIAHVFRAGELGRLHNPEFTMVEWYRVGQTHLEQMQLTEELVRAFREEVRQSAAGGGGFKLPIALSEAPFVRTTYREAFVRYAGDDLMMMETGRFPAWAAARGMHPPPGLLADDRDGWLNWLLAEFVEPRLGSACPEFLYDYPASQAALAVVRPGEPPVAERFELYWRGIELCNGYHELRDPAELRTRIENESRRRAGEGRAPLPLPGRFLEAMEAGLPRCAGVALGFDRLMMVASGAPAVRDVMPFGFERA